MAVSDAELLQRCQAPGAALSHRGLRSIPIAYQVLLELFYWDKLTSEEMAGILKIPAATVRGRLSKPRELLARAMNRLANSSEALEATLTKLDDWAADCRHQLLAMKDR